MIDGTVTRLWREAHRAWLAAATGQDAPRAGRPRTRPEPSGLPPGRQPGGRTRVRVQLYLDPEVAAWLRAQPGGQSAAVERWAKALRADPDGPSRAVERMVMAASPRSE